MDKQTLFDFAEEENSEFLDRSSLSPDARLLYDEYCKIIGLKELPKTDFEILEEAVKLYFVHQLITFIKGSVKSDSYSIKKALNEGRVKDFAYYYIFIKKILISSAIKKDNYNKRFKDLADFLKAFGDNEIFNIINSFLLDGGISIKEEDLPEILNIMNEYSYLEVEEGLRKCNKNGNFVRNIKFLSKVLQGIREEAEFNKQKWEQDNKDSELQQKFFEIEKFYGMQNIAKRETEENNESVILELMKNIALLKEQSDV